MPRPFSAIWLRWKANLSCSQDLRNTPLAILVHAPYPVANWSYKCWRFSQADKGSPLCLARPRSGLLNNLMVAVRNFMTSTHCMQDFRFYHFHRTTTTMFISRPNEDFWPLNYPRSRCRKNKTSHHDNNIML